MSKSRPLTPADVLAARMSSAKSFEDMAKAAVRTAAKLAGAQICTLWRVYSDGGVRRLRLAAAQGIREPDTLASEVTYDVNPKDGITGYVASTGRTALASSFQQLKKKYAFAHKGRMDHLQWRSKPAANFRSLYAVPLVLSGVVQGVLKVENRKGAKGFSKRDISIIDALRTPIAVLAKSLQILDAQESRLLEVPAQLVDALVRPFEAGLLTQKIVDMTAETLNARVCSLWLVDESGTRLTHKASRGFAGQLEQIPPYRVYPPETPDKNIDGISAWVATRQKPFWANSHAELSKHPSWRGTWDPTMYGDKAAAAKRFHSMYAVPLLLNNQVLGVLKVENPRSAAHFTLADRRKCDLMANYVVLLLALDKQLRLELLPSMAHTMKSPAAAMVIMLDQLGRNLAKPKPDLNRLRDFAEEIKKLVFAVLTMSQTIMGEVSARMDDTESQATEVRGFLAQQLPTLNQLAPAGISTKLAADSHPFDLSLSRRQKTWLEIVIFNLAHNAIRYSPPGGIVELCCGTNGDSAFISVTDQGPGVPPEDRERIFELYYHTDVKDWPKGSGLGLFEVRRLLSALKWTIEESNVSPSGARFEICIPPDWRGVSA